MENKQDLDDFPDLSRECIDWDGLCGTWESIDLNPSLIIYRNKGVYKVSVIHISDFSGQAFPSTYEIQQDETGSFIHRNSIRLDIVYYFRSDALKISQLGSYRRI